MEAPFYHDDVVGLHSFGQVSAFASYSSKNVALLRQGKAAAQTSPLPGVLQATACVGGPPLLPPSSSTSSLVSSASSSSPPSPPPPPPPAPPSALSSAVSSSSSSSSTSSSPSESAMLRLSSSDMERFIIHHHHRQQQQQQQHHHLHHLHQGGPGLSAPLSPGLHGAVSGAFGRGGGSGSAAEEEKDNFANGFVRALEELHKQNIRHSAASSFSSSCSPALVSQLHGSGYEAPSPHHQQQHQQHLLPSYAPLLPQHHAAADGRQGPPSSSSPAACYADLGGYGPQLGLASTGGGGGLQQGLAGTSAGGLEYGTSALYAHAQSAGHASSLQYLPRSQQQQLLLKEEEEETLQTVPDLMHEGGGGGGGPSNASSTSSSSSSSSAAAAVSDLVGRGATAPVDMESQEKMKVERKRLRNRIAASKCRKRKLERIARLEEKVAALKANNAQLAGTAGTLREQVDTLKQRVLNHLGRGCRLAIGATQGGTALQAF